MKINENKNIFNWAYKIGFFIILALPVLIIPPQYFSPPDWGKSIVFRSILAILLFLFVFQLLFRKSELNLPDIKLNGKPWACNGAGKIVWALAALFIVFLLASIFSVDPYFSFWGSPYRGGGFVTYAFCFIFAILAFILFKKQDWQRAWIFSIFIGILVCFIGIIQYYGLFNRIFLSVPDRPSSTMGNPILLAIYLLLLFFPALSFAIKEPFSVAQGRQNKYLKIFYIFSLAIFLYTILITGSRAAYLGIVIGALYFFLFYPIKSSKAGLPSAEFNGASPKKIMILKIAIICLLILMAGIVFYANTVNQYPEYLQQNRLFKSVVPRLSLSLFSTDPRFYAWSGIEYKILIDKPVLGYGPENFAVGFDKYYDPSIPYLDKNWGDWWDKAHNIIIQIGTEAGILGIIAYLALFIILFWQLHKIKQADKKAGINTKTALMAHGIQAALISYFVAIFFSFDSFGTYLIFFFLIGYSLHLSNEISGNLSSPAKISIKPWIKTVIMSLLFCVLMFFLWQYNLLPFQINAEMNKAGSLADQKYCSQSFSLMDKLLLNRTFLDSYARMQYVEFTKICNKYYPEDNLAYIKKGLTLINEALKIQPLYTRYWLYMGNYTSILASKEKNIETKNNLLKQADYYFDRALQISPKHQEIVIGQAEMAITAGDYKDAKNYSEKCISLNPGFGECYWHLALSEIFLKDIDDAKKNIETASSKGYDINSKTSLSQLSNAYNYTLDYKSLVSVYEKLIAIDPNVGQYHSTLAFIYKELGQYGKARQEALIVLKLSPESKSNVDEFLKTLP